MNVNENNRYSTIASDVSSSFTGCFIRNTNGSEGMTTLWVESHVNNEMVVL